LRAVNQQLESALAQKTVLLKEVHHRVKNNLAVVSSLLSMKADTLEMTEAREALEESQRRVHSIALIHEQLYGSETPDRIDFSEYAQQLAGELHASFVSEPERIAIRLDVAPIEMGLILNELVSNAFKHAFPGGRRGEVVVSLQESAPSQLEFAVEDNGIGSPAGLAERDAKSLGLKIVGILGRQLEGTLEQQSDSGAGTRFVLRFPAGSSRLRQAAAG
jgi:two-component sensor histidine kinase